MKMFCMDKKDMLYQMDDTHRCEPASIGRAGDVGVNTGAQGTEVRAGGVAVDMGASNGEHEKGTRQYGQGDGMTFGMHVVREKTNIQQKIDELMQLLCKRI